jgi:hypothetical protein
MYIFPKLFGPLQMSCCTPCCEPCCWPFPVECPHPHPLSAFTSGTGRDCGRTQAYLIPATPFPNADIVLDTKGTGALYRSNTFPDTNACRGNYSTDLQSNRTATTQVASGDNAVIAGGNSNTASGTTSVVTGGESNLADGDHSFVGGGSGNHADGSLSVVAGGSGNIAGSTTAGLAVVGGGGGNIATGASSVVGGGSINTASGNSSTIVGGASNVADANATFIGGGTLNMTHGATSTIAGGGNNVTGSIAGAGAFSSIGGGSSNTTNGIASTIPGGFLNVTNGSYSAALGGYGLLLTDLYSAAVGAYNDPITPPTVPTGGYRLFMIGNGIVTARTNVFSVDQAGNVRATGTFTTVPAGGADFAEYIESDSGEHYPYGTSVTLLPNGKIKRAQQGETPIGVVSNSAAFVCGGGDDYWQGKYERDEHGSIVLEDVPIDTHDGETVLRKALKLSSKFDPSKVYIPRRQRPEWHAVGLLGFVEVLDGETVHPNWVRLHQKQAKPGTTWHLLR